MRISIRVNREVTGPWVQAYACAANYGETVGRRKAARGGSSTTGGMPRRKCL